MSHKKRVKITINRSDPPHDIKIISNSGDAFDTHKVILLKYEYFRGIILTFGIDQCSSIEMPFSSYAVNMLIELLYTNYWEKTDNVDEILRILDFVGIKNKSFLYSLIARDDYEKACRHLELYGKYDFIKPKRFKTIKYTNQTPIIIACCMSDDAFASVLTEKIKFCYVVVRYICLVTKNPDNKTIPQLKNIIDESEKSIPNYKCMRDIKNYNDRVVKLKYFQGESVIHQLLRDIEVDNCCNLFDSDDGIHNCYGHDDGW
jgi:hypothetical protein